MGKGRVYSTNAGMGAFLKTWPPRYGLPSALLIAGSIFFVINKIKMTSKYLTSGKS